MCFVTSPSNIFQLIYITDDPLAAGIAASAGVDRIMVDLEIDGKVARQGHLDTVISRHSPLAIKHVSKQLAEIGKGEVLVRLNPVNEKSASEIDNAISFGAQRLMLPMFRTANEVSQFLDLVAGRVPVTLLLETKSAYQNLDEILRINSDFDLHIGLNDLHLEMGLDFMFQLLINGVVDEIAKRCNASGRAFGIGGVAPLSAETKLSPLDILAYHVSLGSNCVILSRDWRECIVDPEKFAVEVQHIRNYISNQPTLDQVALEAGVKAVTKLIRQKRGM